MAVDGDTFRALMRQFPAGVTIVTFNDDGTRGGLTVSSFCSLSLEPPLVLVCIDRGVASHDAIARAGKFGVSVCAADQGGLAGDFANPEKDKQALLEATPHSLASTVPLLDDCVATMACRVVAAHEAGDHTIYVGQVESGTADESRKPLAYCRAGLGSFSPA